MWFEPLIILGIGALISLGLYTYYLPQIRDMKKRYEQFSSKVKEKLVDMTEEERREFFSSMPRETESFFKGILQDDFDFHGIEQFQISQFHLQQVEQINQEQFHQFTQWAMDEGLKSVTPLIMAVMYRGQDLIHQILWLTIVCKCTIRWIICILAWII